jgi:hypothetical protein
MRRTRDGKVRQIAGTIITGLVVQSHGHTTDGLSLVGGCRQRSDAMRRDRYAGSRRVAGRPAYVSW